MKTGKEIWKVAMLKKHYKKKYFHKSRTHEDKWPLRDKAEDMPLLIGERTMKRAVVILWVILFAQLFIGCIESPLPKSTDKAIVALIPPMGWNSFNAYDSAINEE